ncbi:MAG: Fis family transcriptional regulator [Alcaligenaceae bacterium]|nr:MAG: Fis family transcriptional regulator [Alcaligenaceae bacterium]
MKINNVLDQAVRLSLENYFADLGDAEPTDLYDMVVGCVERPLLAVAMQRANNNQSHAALMLGITRNTLRKKLLAHKLI